MIRKKEPIKAYIITGFLESGKTEFIKYTLSQPYFQLKGKTLLIQCEEGEVSYEADFLKNYKIQLESIENEEDFTEATLVAFVEEHKPERIIIEYNGMWNHRGLPLPSAWEVEQQVTVIDTTTFGMYYNNMKSAVGEMVRNSELILFNRADGNTELTTYKRNIKIVNQQADIIFEGKEAEINAVLDEELPYDMQADVIEITEEMYGIWFLDALDHTERYVGKTVSFLAKVLKRESFPINYFVPIRVVMTCCMDDLAQLGFICEYEDAKRLNDGDWVHVTATVSQAFMEEYGSEGPVLHASLVTDACPPDNEILEFN